MSCPGSKDRKAKYLCYKCDTFIYFMHVVPMRNFSGVKNALHEVIVNVVMESAYVRMHQLLGLRF